MLRVSFYASVYIYFFFLDMAVGHNMSVMRQWIQWGMFLATRFMIHSERFIQTDSCHLGI